MVTQNWYEHWEQQASGIGADWHDSINELDNSDDYGCEVVKARLTGSFAEQRLSEYEFSESVFDAARFTLARFTSCRFRNVVFRDCDLSGVSFIDCVFTNCYIVGGKSSSSLEFVECYINRLLVVNGFRAELIALQDCRLNSDLVLQESTIASLRLFGVRSGSPRKRPRLILSDLELSKIGGIDQAIRDGNIRIVVDPGLWTLLGHLMLREIGVEQILPDSHS